MTSPLLMANGEADLERLTPARLHAQVDLLAQADAVLARVVAQHGYPPLWQRPPGFATLIHIILEQQVSLASAQAAFDKLERALGAVTPKGMLGFSDAALKATGFSRQKARYARALAQAVLGGELVLEQLTALSDEAVRERLTRLPGIGDWTASIYLMMALGREDIWPKGDVALTASYSRLCGLSERLSGATLAERALSWRPYRSAAAQLLWHAYLSR
jgi:DNA-3-methyladenine glycosylase II